MTQDRILSGGSAPRESSNARAIEPAGLNVFSIPRRIRIRAGGCSFEQERWACWESTSLDAKPPQTRGFNDSRRLGGSADDENLTSGRLLSLPIATSSIAGQKDSRCDRSDLRGQGYVSSTSTSVWSWRKTPWRVHRSRCSVGDGEVARQISANHRGRVEACSVQ